MIGISYTHEYGQVTSTSADRLYLIHPLHQLFFSIIVLFCIYIWRKLTKITIKQKNLRN